MIDMYSVFVGFLLGIVTVKIFVAITKGIFLSGRTIMLGYFTYKGEIYEVHKSRWGGK